MGSFGTFPATGSHGSIAARESSLMGDDDLPTEVRDLVGRRLGSMEEVEILLLLAGVPDALAAGEIRERLRMPPSLQPMASLARLIDNDLICEERGESEPLYRYAPARPELRRAVDLLAIAYNQRPVTLVRLVYHRPSAAQSFADAFRVRKPEDR